MKLKNLNKAISLIVVVSFIFSNHVAFALPSGYTVESGTAEFDTSDPSSLVIHASDQAIINFDSFSIGQNETVRFIQASDTSSLLSRVIGGSATDISGSLFSNGTLFLINSNGINFREGANIQVNNLIASTLNLQSAMYLSGQYAFEKQVGSNPGKILNQASISGRNIALLSESIENQGVLEANLGSVVLGIGERQTLSFDSDGSISLVIDQGLADSLNKSIQNSGTIQADGGKVLLSAKTFNDTMDTLINNTGILQATRAVEKDGKIVFESNTGNVNSGTIDTNLFIEEGYSFFNTQTASILGGSAFYDNIDGAANISGSIGSNQTDTGDLIVVGNIMLTAGTLTFTADSDNDGVGKFDMNSGTTINTLASCNLTLKTGENSNLRVINVTGLTLDRAGSASTPTYTMNGEITFSPFVSLTVAANTTLNVNGQALTGLSSGSVVNNGTIKLIGSETLTEISDLDIDSGTVEYIGNNDATGNFFNIFDFGATDYYNLVINAPDTVDSFRATSAVSVAGALTVTSGKYEVNGSSLTVAGLTTVNGGEIYDSALGVGTRTFNGGLTLSSGTYYGNNDTSDINGNLTISGGLFDASTGSTTVSGNFSHSGGTFTHNIGTVTLDGTNQTISGNTTFYNLAKTVTTARTLTFEAGSTTTVTNNINLAGASGQLLSLRSSSDGSQWLINLPGLGGQTFSYLDVKDSNNTGTKPSTITGVVNSLGNTNWFGLTLTWTGTTNTNFGTATNWDLGSAPTSADDVVIADVANDPIFGANFTLGSLTINSSGILDIAGFNLTVSGALSNNGTLKLQGSETVSFGTMDTNSGTVEYTGATGTNSYATGLAAGNAYYNLSFSGASDTWILGAALDVNNNLTISNGTLDVKSGSNYQVNVAKNFDSTGGTFLARSGSVVLDGTNQTISGNNSFYNLNKTVAVADTLTFAAGSTTTITGLATLKGAASNLLTLTSAGGWNIDPQGTKDIQYVAVVNSTNLSGAVIDPANSTNGGGNVNWFSVAPIVPDPRRGCVELGNCPEITPRPIIRIKEWFPDPETKHKQKPEDKPRPILDKDPEDEEITSTTHVFEGAVYVVGVDGSEEMLYDGESMSVSKRGARILRRGIYVSSVDGLLALRGKTYEKMKEMKLKQRPSAIAASKKGDSVYVAPPDSTGLLQVDTASFNSKNIKGLNEGANNIALSEKGDRAFITDGRHDKVQVFDTESQNLLREISVGSLPTQAVLSADEKYVYVVERLDATISKYDASTGKKILSAKAGISPYGVVLSPETNTIYITDTMGGKVLVFNESLKKQTEIKVGQSPHAIIADAKGGKIYVANRSEESISMIDISKNEVLSTIAVGKRPSGLAVLPEGNNLYVANELSNNLSVVDTHLRRSIQEIPTGMAPNQVVISSPNNS